MTETIGDALTRAAALLQQAGIDNPRLEARLLLAHAHGIPQETLLREPHLPLRRPPLPRPPRRRLAREPLALILGHREFWSLDLAVSPATLIPRPDSETLIEAALDAFPERTAVRRILDLGTGTGALLLAALAEFPAAFGIGLDRVPAAAALAAANARSLGLAPRAAFLAGDWAAAISARFDLVLANPPYICRDEVAGLMPELAHEPRSALDGGPTVSPLIARSSRTCRAFSPRAAPRSSNWASARPTRSRNSREPPD